MDSQHVLNPWNAQQLLPLEKDHNAKRLSFFRTHNSSPAVESDHNDFYRFTTQDFGDDLERLHSRRQAHMRSWSYEETIAASDTGEQGSESEAEYVTYEKSRTKRTVAYQGVAVADKDENQKDPTADQYAIDDDDNNNNSNEGSNLTASSATLVEPTSIVGRHLSDSGVGMDGDVLEHLVQQLQSEVADTRAVVFDLESRLNAAEHSNKHIVEELKTLLADAEGTLVGSDDSDTDSVAVSSKHGSGTEEDSNIVYNRICNALQTLIAEAQSALVRKSSLTPPPLDRESLQQHRRLRLRQGQPQSLLQAPGGAATNGTAVSSLFVNDTESSRQGSSNLSSRRSSWTPSSSRMTNNGPCSLASLTQHSPSPLPPPRMSGHHTNRRSFSRMIWKEKQQEQYERYRRSCDMISYELEMMLDDSLIHSDVGEATEELLQAPTVVKPSALFGTWSLDRAGLRLGGRDMKKTTAVPLAFSKAERLQRKYQAQVLGSQVRARRHGESFLSDSTTAHAQGRSLLDKYHQHRRPVKSQGVGPGPSQNILVQLYRLWKQSWLRTRIMHVLTGSLEMMLIVWVVFKLSEISLGWMGVRLLTGDMNNGPQEWLAYIYGYRNSTGASAAKELYKKIRQDGLVQRARRAMLEQESKALMVDYIKAETAPGMPQRHFSPYGMVWGPAGNALTHIVSGVVLAFLSDRVKGLSRKL
ncbi:hypothetical protein BGZ83_004559 [Gryganskiella cystojenkinii]|nr:hypothetical protein BGZ83_004559 [Gryganskiella cystojenkinii]